MNDFEKTIAPKRRHNQIQDDLTMPGRRDRKADGRFAIGDLILSRYKVLALLGQGGMGVVYKCFDEVAGIEIALKALPPELSHNTIEMEDIKDNFQLVHNLHHPNIAASNNLERDDSNGNYYLIMECAEGEDLRRWLRRKSKDGNMSFSDILAIVAQVASALDYAHAQKILHRDIKPGNIMIATDGSIKVLDFGLAAQIHTSMTRVSMAYHGTSGTGPYMAPEQWRGRAQGPSADQYALAVMTYEMFSGRLPFESTDAAVLQQAVLTQTAEAITGIPKYAQAAIMRALSKDPTERFLSCSDFISALNGKKTKSNTKYHKGILYKILAILLFFILCGSIGTGYYFFDKQKKEKARLERFEEEKKQKIKQIVSAAESAKARALWKEVIRLSQEILLLDSNNLSALSLRKEAEQAIIIAEKQLAEKKALEIKRLENERRLIEEQNKIAEEKRQKDNERRVLDKKRQAEQQKKDLEQKRSESAQKKAELQKKLKSQAYSLNGQVQELLHQIDSENYVKDDRFSLMYQNMKSMLSAGSSALKDDEFEIAIENFEKAIKGARDIVSQCQKVKTNDKLPLSPRVALQRNPVMDWLNEAKALVAAQRYPEAHAVIKKIMQKEPDNTEALSMLDIYGQYFYTYAKQAITKEEYRNAIAILEQMRPAVDGQGEFLLGCCYEKINNIEQAQVHVTNAVKKNNNDALFWLGSFYSSRDKKKAIDYFKLAAHKGKKQAYLSIAILYLDKKSSFYNESEGIRYMKMAAEAGVPSAQYNLGCCYAKFRGADYSCLPYDKNLAIKWLRRAKNNNVSVAERALRRLED